VTSIIEVNVVIVNDVIIHKQFVTCLFIQNNTKTTYQTESMSTLFQFFIIYRTHGEKERPQEKSSSTGISTTNKHIASV
jgi:hypothetical protein